MDPLEAPQRFDYGGPDVRAEECQGGLRPLLEGQPVEDTFDDIAHRLKLIGLELR